MVTVTMVAGIPTYGTDRPLIRPVEAVAFGWDAAAGTPGNGVALVRIPPAVRVGGTTEVARRLNVLSSPSEAVPTPAGTLKPIGPIVPDVAADLEPVTPPAADPVDESVYRHGTAYDEQAESDESVPDDDGGGGETVADEHPADEEPAADSGEESAAGPATDEASQTDAPRQTAETDRAAPRRSDSVRADHHGADQERVEQERVDQERVDRERLDRERLERERESAAALKRRADRDDRLRRLAESDRGHRRQAAAVGATTIDDVRPPAPVDHERPRGTPEPPVAAVGDLPRQAVSSPHAGSGGAASAGGSTVTSARAAPPAAVSGAAAVPSVIAGVIGAGHGLPVDVGAIRAMTHAHPAEAVRAVAGSAPLDVFTLLRPA